MSYQSSPNVLPGSPIIKEKHHDTVAVILVALCCVLVIVSFAVLLFGPRDDSNVANSPSMVSNNNNAKRDMIATLRQNSTPASAKDIKAMTVALKKTRSTVTQAEKQTMINTLKQ